MTERLCIAIPSYVMNFDNAALDASGPFSESGVQNAFA